MTPPSPYEIRVFLAFVLAYVTASFKMQFQAMMYLMVVLAYGAANENFFLLVTVFYVLLMGIMSALRSTVD